MRSLVTTTVLAAALAVASGCSSFSKEDEAAASGAGGLPAGLQTSAAISGSRLRANIVTGGGAREVVGFFDTARNEGCTFQRAEGSRTRCLPTTASYNPSGLFADAACEKPMAAPVEPCGASAKYAFGLRYDGSTCQPGATELRRVVAAPPGARYTDSGGLCRPQSVAPNATAPIIALGEIVPWTDFVEGTETVVAGEALAETVLVGTDGSRQHLGHRIESLEADCTFQVMPDGVTRCVPEGGTGSVFYADSTCSKAAFVNVSDNGPCPTVGKKVWLEPASTGGACSGPRAVYSLRLNGVDGAEEPSELYTFTQYRSRASAVDTETCTSIGSNRGYNTVRKTIEADLTATLPTTRRLGSGAGRLVPALVAAREGAALVAGWHDIERNVDCTFRPASDGKLRCLPTGAAATVFSTDAACKSAGRVAVLGPSPCTGSTGFATVTSTTCPATTRVYTLGTEARNLTTASAESTPGRCVSFAGVNSAVDATEVDPAQFVEGVSATE